VKQTHKRRKISKAKRKAEEQRWAQLSGPVVTYIDPTRKKPTR